MMASGKLYTEERRLRPVVSKGRSNSAPKRSSPSLTTPSSRAASTTATPRKLAPIHGPHSETSPLATSSVLTTNGVLTTEDILRSCRESDCLKVTSIDLRASKLKSVPSLIKKFTRVKTLDLSGNSIGVISGLDSNQQLTDLILYDNVVEVLENLECLKELNTLHFQFNRVQRIGDGLKRQGRLQFLRLDHNRIQRIEAVELLPFAKSLKVLNVSNNALTNISALTSLSVLEELDVGFNQLSDLPKLSSMPRLAELDASHNQLRTLVGLNDCDSLTSLRLAHNGIRDEVLKELADGNAVLPSLDLLDISKNGLVSLDLFARLFPALTILDLDDNDVDDDDVQLQHLKDLPLSELSLQGNPLSVQSSQLLEFTHLEMLNGKRVGGKVGSVLTNPEAIHPVGHLLNREMREIETQMSFEYEDMLHKFQTCRTSIASSLPSVEVAEEAVRASSASASSTPDSPLSKSHQKILRAKNFSRLAYDNEDEA